MPGRTGGQTTFGGSGALGAASDVVGAVWMLVYGTAYRRDTSEAVEGVQSHCILSSISINCMNHKTVEDSRCKYGILVGNCTTSHDY